MGLLRRLGWAAALLGGAAVAQTNPQTAAAPQIPAPTLELLSTQCVACHGTTGSSPIPMYPNLAGQSPVYTLKQLQDFLSGKRINPVMTPFLDAIRGSDTAAIAAYYAAQPPAAAAMPPATAASAAQATALVNAGRALYEDGNSRSNVPGCVGCHQAGAVGYEEYPRLAGQHSDYTLAQMNAFKEGGRDNDRAKVMRAIAQRMTPEEISAVAAYLASLR